jgi:hypothetical protein
MSLDDGRRFVSPLILLRQTLILGVGGDVPATECARVDG